MSDPKSADAKSYKDTVLLPKTDFSTRANAVKREPELQAFWDHSKIYETLSQENSGEVFVLHDGSPYANGNLHMGHALNKVLKDIIIINKYQLCDRCWNYSTHVGESAEHETIYERCVAALDGKF